MSLDFFPFLVFVALLVAVPFLFLLATAFIKAAVVLLILRNAIGIQQTPPNMVVYAIAGAIAVFVGYPVIVESFDIVTTAQVDYSDLAGWETVARDAAQPFIRFLSANVERVSLATFERIAIRLWPPELVPEDPRASLVLMIPAFVLSELTRAFQMGFLIFLPFLAIDLIVTTVLMALGMQQVQPTIISVPFKLLLFVSLQGWEKIVNGLLLTYVA